jgi:hypothetical protein
MVTISGYSHQLDKRFTGKAIGPWPLAIGPKVGLVGQWLKAKG